MIGNPMVAETWQDTTCHKPAVHRSPGSPQRGGGRSQCRRRSTAPQRLRFQWWQQEDAAGVHPDRSPDRQRRHRVSGRVQKKTGVTVKLIIAPFGQLYTKTLADFQTGGGSYDVVLAASSWLGDLQAFIVDITDPVHKDKALDWSDVLFTATRSGTGGRSRCPSTVTTSSATTAGTSCRTRVSKQFPKEFGKPLAPPTTWTTS